MAMLLPTVSVAQKVRTDDDHAAASTKYKTYKWVKIGENSDVNQLVDERIVAAIDAQMAKDGLTKTEDNPDLLIGYHASVKQQQQLTTFNDGMGPGWGYGPGRATVRDGLRLDRQQKKLVFRGLATDTLSDKPEKNQKKIQKAVTKIFEKYPPKEKS